MKKEESITSPKPNTPEQKNEHDQNTTFQTCAICLNDLEDLTPTYTLECKHQFHRACIVEWFKQKHTCPYCRREIFIQNESRIPPNPNEIRRYVRDGIVSLALILEIFLKTQSQAFRGLYQRTERVIQTPTLRRCIREYSTNPNYSLGDLLRMTATGLFFDYLKFG